MFCTSGDFRQGLTNFLCLTWLVVISVTQLSQSRHPEIDTSEVMKQNVTTNFLALQMHKSDMTVVSGSKSYPQSWCHMPTLFWRISKISPFCTSGDFWWLLAEFHQLSLSDLIRGDKCNSTMTVMSSWSWYLKVMKQNIAMGFPALQMHNSDMTVVSGLKSYPQSWCHMPTLFSEISEISPFCTFDDFWWLLAGFHQFSLSDLISGYRCNSTMTVMSSWSRYVKSYKAKLHYELPSPYTCTFPTWQLCWAQRAILKVGVPCLPYFQK